MSPLVRTSLALVAFGVGMAATWWALERDPKPASGRTLLLTGFGPFGDVTTNPSWEVARALDGALLGDMRVVAARLDVTYADAPRQLGDALAAHRPDLVLSLGLAPTPAIRIETTAINRDRSFQPDNAGVVHADDPIREGGPDTLPTRLPVEQLQAILADADFDVVTSDDAGGYLCNHVFYRVLDQVDPAKVAGFIHVPPLEGAWYEARLVAAIRLVLEVLALGSGEPGR